MKRTVFTFGTLYPDVMIKALLGTIPQNFYGTLEGYSVYKGAYNQLPPKIREGFDALKVYKKTFSYLFAKPDASSRNPIEGRAYSIDFTQELILDHWERYPVWYRKREVVVNDADGKKHNAFVYTLDIEGEKVETYERVLNDPERARQNAVKMRTLVLEKHPEAFK